MPTGTVKLDVSYRDTLTVTEEVSRLHHAASWFYSWTSLLEVFKPGAALLGGGGIMCLPWWAHAKANTHE